VAVCKVVPIFYREFPIDVNIYASADSIVFSKIRKLGWISSNLAETIKQITLFAGSQRPENIENFNGNKKP